MIETPVHGRVIEEVESLRSILVARATGGVCSDVEYKAFRQRLLENPMVRPRLPELVIRARTLDDVWHLIKPRFDTYADRRNYLREQFGPLLDWLERQSAAPSDDGVSATLRQVNSEYIDVEWKKALERRRSDPEGAITSARTMIEAVCKHILDAQGIAYDDSQELPKLYRQTAESLKLAPNQHDEGVFRQILGGCQTVVEGLGAMRNRMGDAHGKRAARVRPAPRHAELAVNLAGGMVAFLLATFEARGARAGE